jgi:histidine ammonia-lyase/phenylalanine ammonia-lyase
MAGIAALVTLDAQRLSLLADIATAMTTEVLTASSGPFHAFLHEGTKPHPGQCRSAANIRHLLEGSELSQAYQKIVGGLGQLSGGMRKLPTKIQSKYSVRCAPHFIGVLNDTIDWCERWLDVEMNSANDNPLFDADEGEVHSGGNFAGGHVAFLADSLKTAVASVADLLDRQFELIVDEKFSEGLPSNLSPELPPDHPEAGTHHGFKGVQLAVSSLTAEALGRCLPMTIFSRSTEAHNQDKVSMGATAARGARDVVVLAEKVAAFHLLALCQAADFRDARKLGRTRAVYERIRRESEKVTGDRELAGDLERLLSCIRSGELTRLAFAASK